MIYLGRRGGSEAWQLISSAYIANAMQLKGSYSRAGSLSSKDGSAQVPGIEPNRREALDTDLLANAFQHRIAASRTLALAFHTARGDAAGPSCKEPGGTEINLGHAASSGAFFGMVVLRGYAL